MGFESQPNTQEPKKENESEGLGNKLMKHVLRPLAFAAVTGAAAVSPMKAKAYENNAGAVNAANQYGQVFNGGNVVIRPGVSGSLETAAKVGAATIANQILKENGVPAQIGIDRQGKPLIALNPSQIIEQAMRKKVNLELTDDAIVAMETFGFNIVRPREGFIGRIENKYNTIQNIEFDQTVSGIKIEKRADGAGIIITTNYVKYGRPLQQKLSFTIDKGNLKPLDL